MNIVKNLRTWMDISLDSAKITGEYVETYHQVIGAMDFAWLNNPEARGEIMSLIEEFKNRYDQIYG